MLTADIENFLAQGFELMGLQFDNQAETLDRLVRYFQELKKWNRKVNLVARTLDDKQILENHFLDSLTLLALLPPEKQKQERLLDIGTGAGFPGLVLGAACPSLSITLVEPRKNRFYFLKHIIRALNLQDVKVLNVRLEEKIEKPQLADKQFSFITSRAFTDISKFSILAAPYLAQNGKIVCMKGAGVLSEMGDFMQRGSKDNFFVAQTVKLQLPFSGAERLLLVIKSSDDQQQ